MLRTLKVTLLLLLGVFLRPVAFASRCSLVREDSRVSAASKGWTLPVGMMRFTLLLGQMQQLPYLVVDMGY